jgi:DNA-binding HxlR family transcriptional regulator
MRWDEIGEEACSVARTVAVIGDRWTLLILRDCFLGIRRFDDFQTRIGVTRPILADRLKKLVAEGILAKVAYDDRPPRFEYRLTEEGRALHPVMMAIVHWGDTHRVTRKGRPLLHTHKTCGHDFDPVMTCSHCAAPLSAREVEVRVGPGAVHRHPV